MNMKTCVMCVAAAILGLGCSDDESLPGNGNAGSGGGGGGGEFVSFEADIHPILKAKCAGSDCHGVDFGAFRPGHAQEDVEDAYAATQLEVSTDVFIYDRMVSRASGTDDFGPMPPPPTCNGALGFEGCLTQAEFDLLERWVEQGARP